MELKHHHLSHVLLGKYAVMLYDSLVYTRSFRTLTSGLVFTVFSHQLWLILLMVHEKDQVTLSFLPWQCVLSCHSLCQAMVGKSSSLPYISCILHSTRQVCQRRVPHLNQLYIAGYWSWLAFFMWIEDNLWVNMSGRHDSKSSCLSFFWPQELSQYVNTVGEPTGCISSTHLGKT